LPPEHNKDDAETHAKLSNIRSNFTIHIIRKYNTLLCESTTLSFYHVFPPHKEKFYENTMFCVCVCVYVCHFSTNSIQRFNCLANFYEICVRILHNWSPFQRSNYFHAIGNYNMADAENFEVEAKTRFSQGIASVLPLARGCVLVRWRK